MRLRPPILPATLFTEGSTSRSDKVVAVISGIGLIGWQIIGALGNLLQDKISNGPQVVLEVCYFLFFAVGLFGLLYVGIRMVGRSAGVKGFWHSLVLVLWRTFLYLILPAIVVAILIVAYAHFAGW